MKISRLDPLKNRYARIQRCRELAIKENNLFKKKQADFLINKLATVLEILSKPMYWN